jgi:hypothetical protein
MSVGVLIQQGVFFFWGVMFAVLDNAKLFFFSVRIEF